MCVDYSAVPHSKTMSEILIPQCTKKMSGSMNLFLWLFSLFWVAKVFQYIMDIRRLRHMHDFFLYLLEVNDSDIQTVSWQDIVARLMVLRDANPVTAPGLAAKSRRFMGNQSKQRMDAHDIANRLMRKENYLIALFNKDILNLTLPIPFLRDRQLFSKTLEWNLNMCILDYVFNEQGQVRPLFLKDTHRRKLSDGLRRRFLFAGTMNVICAPFIVGYLIMLYFFRYFTVSPSRRKNFPSSHTEYLPPRNTKRIRLNSALANIPRWPSGNSENSTSCGICFSGELTCPIPSHRATSTNFRKTRLCKYRGSSPL